MDNLTIEQRRKNISNIRSKNTRLEMLFFSMLDKEHISYIKYPELYGKPDCQIGEKILIFIDSDFWHGWRFNAWRNRLPKTYWVQKIQRNIKRDKTKFRKLRRLGYMVIRIWEHQLKKDPFKVEDVIRRAIHNADFI
jgi:DNA mismatch endonuclease, patch repair protein